MGTCKHPAEFRAAAFWIDGRRFDKTVHVVVTKPGVVRTGGVGRAARPVSESIPDLPGFSLEKGPSLASGSPPPTPGGSRSVAAIRLS